MLKIINTKECRRRGGVGEEQETNGTNRKQIVKGEIKTQLGHPTSWYLLKLNETYVRTKTYNQV